MNNKEALEKLLMELDVEIGSTITYSSNEIVYEKCEFCGEKARDVYKKWKVNPYPKNINETKLCRQCWVKLISKELN